MTINQAILQACREVQQCLDGHHMWRVVPVAGYVRNVPVRVGDRVCRSCKSIESRPNLGIGNVIPNARPGCSRYTRAREIRYSDGDS